MRRFLTCLSLVAIVLALVGGGGLRQKVAGPGKITPGLYLIDSEKAAAFERLPGVVAGEETAGKRLVKITVPLTLPLRLSLHPYPPEARIAPELKSDGAAAAGVLTVTISLFSPQDKENVARAVEAAGGAILRGLDEPEAAALRAKLPRSALQIIAARDDVVRIEPYAPHRFLVDRAARVTGVAPLFTPGFLVPGGLTGSGQIVGIADNGFDKGNLEDVHPDFASTPGRIPKVVLLRSWANGPLGDLTGHGTHVAGIVAGTGAASKGKFRGLAPESSIYFQAITNVQGEPDPPADLVSLFRPAYSAGVRIHVDGWGGGKNTYNAAAAQIDRFCFYNPDFLPVFGAGNAGPASGSLTAEANSKNALVVGASENPRPLLGYRGGVVARFSSRGPAGDGRVKPDLVAPGAGIIAPASRLAPSSGQGYYRQLDGTSMAAAVAGSAALLLREYLQRVGGLAQPPAALLKALLINGARPVAPVDAGGFGQLDLFTTVLALKEGTFRYVLNPGLREKESVSYEVVVEDPQAPLKITLCWTDPPALPGAASALVNDLDLVVVGPDGERFYGNDFAGRGLPDRVNNVEQVSIVKPVRGRYVVTVNVARLGGGAASSQPFALVYGQVPRREVVESLAQGRISLAGGRGQMVVPQEVAGLLNGRKVFSEEALVPGADLYLIPGKEKAYAVAEQRVMAPASFLNTGSGVVIVQENQPLPEGGYLLRTGKVHLAAGEVEAKVVPPGVRAELWVNPASQTVWAVRALWAEKQGFLEGIVAGKVRLIGGESYCLAPGWKLGRETDLTGLDPLDKPFGAFEPVDELPAGLPVTLRLDPQSGEVLRIGVRQDLVSGFIQTVGNQKVVFEDGRAWALFPGAQLRLRDKLVASPALLAPGDHLTGVLFPGGNELLCAWAERELVYGEVLFLDSQRKTLHLQDVRGDYRLFDLAPGATFYCGGVSVGPSVLFPGQWVRLQLGPTGRILRVDLAGTVDQATGTISGYDSEKWLIYLNGVPYKLSSRSLIIKNGYPVALLDLRPGEEATVVFWRGAETTPVALAVKAVSEAPPPLLEVIPSTYGAPLRGRTTGTRVYLYPGDGRRLTTAVYGGEFSFVVTAEAGRSVRVVSVDERRGGVSGVWVELPGPKVFADVVGCWAHKEIVALAAEGFVSGYPDGTFRPNASLSRAELAVLTARLAPGSARGSVPRDAPSWAQDAVRLAVYRGLLHLTPDGLFCPSAPVNRVTAAVAFAALFPKEAATATFTPPPFRDWLCVPEWARDAVGLVYAQGVVRGRPDGRFDPLTPLTRAEAAVMVYRARLLLR